MDAPDSIRAFRTRIFKKERCRDKQEQEDGSTAKL